MERPSGSLRSGSEPSVGRRDSPRALGFTGEQAGFWRQGLPQWTQCLDPALLRGPFWGLSTQTDSKFLEMMGQEALLWRLGLLDWP